jgi:hypothetical protein
LYTSTIMAFLNSTIIYAIIEDGLSDGNCLITMSSSDEATTDA